MTTNSPAIAPVSKGAFWTGIVLSVLPVLMLALSAVMKFVQPPDVAKGFEHLGWPMTLALPLAIIELVSAVLYLVPATSVLGAIILTGYLGGAIATHVRVGDPSWPFVLILGIAIWGGLFLRDPRLRALIPLRR